MSSDGAVGAEQRAELAIDAAVRDAVEGAIRYVQDTWAQQWTGAVSHATDRIMAEVRAHLRAIPSGDAAEKAREPEPMVRVYGGGVMGGLEPNDPMAGVELAAPSSGDVAGAFASLERLRRESDDWHRVHRVLTALAGARVAIPKDLNARFREFQERTGNTTAWDDPEGVVVWWETWIRPGAPVASEPTSGNQEEGNGD